MAPPAHDRLDMLLEMTTEIRERLARIEARCEDIPKLEQRVGHLEEMVGDMRVTQAKLQVRVGFWGGIMGTAAFLWQLVKWKF